ncbi:type I-F CRISPR-associated protein Csy3 [Thioclava sp. SK-1]|uniref:type I-F CRISPR-associated protein Csy3 n=1 Tax=Thioclava sp. SK-1 TaxID=1889770 RepID=UPI000824B319|nr:type I-F CRISPR-associated protein Csy3 [Thioclava sp. SK-1]OCX62054.1 type I-F CRISPR-associated protein Csy3 [Thioclava sp. SK-1]
MAKSPNALSLETGMLAFARSVQITEGLFYATNAAKPDLRTPIEVLEKGVRGQSSQDKAKNPGLSNPQSVEYAIVPQGHDGVRLEFSVRFMPLSLRPHACNNTDVGAAYERLADAYRTRGGYSTLALLYVWNIANARFAWRNRFQSDAMTVTVRLGAETLVFDPFRLSLETPATRDDLSAALVTGDGATIDALIAGVAGGLSNESDAGYVVKVAWDAAMEPAQEVFPSQEYVREEKADKQLSRVFAKLPTFYAGRELQQASMHSQKIGAALRHIDIWHGSDAHDGPVAVNPYGGVQETSAVLRDPKSKRSFYDLRAKAEVLISGLENPTLDGEISGDAHFVMANLIRGGVFGASSKKAEANG